MKPIISPHIRLRHPELFEIGSGSIVDDFCYFSTRVIVGRYSHIASGCSVAGGGERTFRLGDFSSLSAGVRIWCTSDDFVNDLVTIIPSGFPRIKENLISGDVTIGRFTAVGSNTVIMPGNELPEGTAVGALSFVPPSMSLRAWTVYAGTPVREIRARNRDQVLRQADAFELEIARRSGGSPP